MNAPAEALEAAAEVVWQNTLNSDHERIAKLVLEAAAPFIAAQALRDAATEASKDNGIQSMGAIMGAWLRDRADNLEATQ